MCHLQGPELSVNSRRTDAYNRGHLLSKVPVFWTYQTLGQHLIHLFPNRVKGARERERSAHRHTALDWTNIKHLIKPHDGISRSRAAESQYRASQMYVHGNTPLLQFLQTLCFFSLLHFLFPTGEFPKPCEPECLFSGAGRDQAWGGCASQDQSKIFPERQPHPATKSTQICGGFVASWFSVCAWFAFPRVCEVAPPILLS